MQRKLLSILVFVVACKSGREFDVAKARNEALATSAPFEQMYRHAREQLYVQTNNNYSRIDLAMAATFFAEQINRVAADESPAVAELRFAVYAELAVQLYILTEGGEVWWRSFVLASPARLQAHVFDSFHADAKQVALKSRPKGNDACLEACSFQRDFNDNEIDKGFHNLKFVLFTPAEYQSLTKRYEAAPKNISMFSADYCGNGGNVDDIMQEYPYGWGMHLDIAIQWLRVAEFNKDPKIRSAALACTKRYIDHAMKYSMPKSAERSYVAFWAACIYYHSMQDYLALQMIDREINMAHLDQQARETLARIQGQMSHAIAAEQRKQPQRNVTNTGNSGTTWTYTPNPAAGSGPGNSVISPSGMESYTDSHGNKVRK